MKRNIFSTAILFVQFFCLTAFPALAQVQPTISTPTSSFSNSYATPQMVTITGSSGTLYYTLDGSDPTVSSTRITYPSSPTYTGFSVSTITQINAVEQVSGTYGPTATVYLDIDPSLASILQPGLMLRLRADFGIIPAVGNPAPISKWTDLSGSNNNATGLGGSAPLLITNAINCLPAANLNGAQYLTLPNTTTMNITIGNAPPAATSSQTVTINGTSASYSANTSATNQQIASNLATAINSIPGLSATCATGSNVIQVTAPATAVFTGTPAQGVQMSFQNTGFPNFSITYIAISNSPPAGSGTQTITINGNAANYSATNRDTNQTIATGLSLAINALGLTGITSNTNNNVIQLTAPATTTITTAPSQQIVMSTQNSGATFFAVTQPTALTAGSRLFDLGQAASGNNVLCQIASSGSSKGQFASYSGTSGTYASSTNALVANQYQVLAATQSTGATTGTATFYVNGLPGTTNSGMNIISTVNRTNNFIGQGSSTLNYYSGNICEILLYSSNLTSSQIANITAVLAQKYQILPQPQPPVFSVAGGNLTGPTQVAIKTQPGAKTFFTTDNSVPSNASPAYGGGPMTVNYSQTIKAISYFNGVASPVSSANYTLDSTLFPAPSSSDMTAPTINLQLPAASH